LLKSKKKHPLPILPFFLLVPKLLLWNPFWFKALLCLNSANPAGSVHFAKLELDVQVRSQAGAWERDKRRIRFI
jgi:hypothetical protein